MAEKKLDTFYSILFPLCLSMVCLDRFLLMVLIYMIFFFWCSWLAAVSFLGLRRISTTLHKHSSYLQVPFYLKLVVQLM